MRYLLIALLLLIGCNKDSPAGPIYGCLDSQACNYNPSASIDNDNCTYPDENYDCEGNCTATIDECGVCDGGNASQDCEGVCNGTSIEDCAGVCNGTAEFDVCGECEGSATDLAECLEFYNILIEETGESTLFIFQNTISNLDMGDEIGLFDTNGIVDADGNTGEVLVGAGVWQESQLSIIAISNVDLTGFGGPILPGAVSGNNLTIKIWDSSEQVEFLEATYDIDSGNGTFNGLFTVISEVYFCDIPGSDCDCSGNVLDECGVCGGDGIEDGTCDCFGNVEDCAGQCGGSAVEDECGICNGNGIADGACNCAGNIEDCAGVCGGLATEDECGVCGGGGIANGACDCAGNVEDCAGVCGGLATEDECGVCGGDGSSCNDDSGTVLDGVPNWDCDGDGVFDNLNAYESSGSITVAVFINDVNAGVSEGDMLGAFVGDELRGVGVSTSVPFGPYAGTYQFLTLIYSNEVSTETITFKFYDIETDAVYDIAETIDYIADMTLGNIVSPEILNTSNISSEAYITCE